MPFIAMRKNADDFQPFQRRAYAPTCLNWTKGETTLRRVAKEPNLRTAISAFLQKFRGGLVG